MACAAGGASLVSCPAAVWQTQMACAAGGASLVSCPAAWRRCGGGVATGEAVAPASRCGGLRRLAFGSGCAHNTPGLWKTCWPILPMSPSTSSTSRPSRLAYSIARM
eukprot:5211463-Prymnesium_polylepis.1